ncbi:19035_t:CDS:2, partial [Gigaspora rosea]
NDSGTFSFLQSDTVRSLQDPTSFQITAIATLDGGYALIYANTIIRTLTSDNKLAAQFSENAGIYAIMLGYNQSNTPQSFILYQLTTPNITFTGLYCSVDFVFIGHSCIASLERKQTTAVPSTPTNSSTFYVRIRFFSSGAILSLDPMLPLNNGSLTNVRTLPFGGYAVITRAYYGQNINYTLNLYNASNALSEYDSSLKQITANFNGAFDVLQNNTILVALNETTTSWQILVADLPPLSPFSESGYGNLHVNATYPQINLKYLPLNTNMINITFNGPIAFSDGNLYIYQKINSTFILRQLINNRYLNLLYDCGRISGGVITLKVLSCTFNDPGGHYFIQMDNNFVKSAVYNKPILGIDQNMWSFQTNNNTSSEKNIDNSGDIRGILRLTISGS